MTEHETDKLFAALARIEARLGKLERASMPDVNVAGPAVPPINPTQDWLRRYVEAW